MILAGGQAKRYGGINKTGIIIEGKTIIERISDVIAGFFDELILVTNDPSGFGSLHNFIVTSDIYPGIGPLAGIHSGLKSCSGDAVFIFAGDMPFPNEKLISSMLTTYKQQGCDILLPRAGNRLEPLHGIYSKKILLVLETFIEKGGSRAVRDFIQNVRHCIFEVEDTPANRIAFTNLNSPGDLDKILMQD